MSIFKDQQRDEVQLNLVECIINFLRKKSCRSYIVFNGDMHVCGYRMAHKGRHKDPCTGVQWGYGDDQFGTSQYELEKYVEKHGHGITIPR